MTYQSNRGTGISLDIRGFTIISDDVKTLYELCATELAINNNPDWCSLLSEEDLDVLQYNSDIEVTLNPNIVELAGHGVERKKAKHDKPN